MKIRPPRATRERKSGFLIPVIVSVVWPILAASLLGCSAEGGTRSTTTPAASQVSPALPVVLTPSPAGDAGTGSIVQRLTESKWQRVAGADPNLASETVTWEFYANGMFRWQFTSDFQEVRGGAWAISPVSEESGTMFLASTMNDPPRFDVLSLTLQNGVLRLGEFSYEEAPFTDTEAPPDIREEDRLAVNDQRDSFFSLWITITASDWRSESDPPPGDSNIYSLMQDGTYTAQFEATQCEYSGTWSLSFSESDSGILWLSIPDNACDPRGAQEAFVREIPIRLDGENLVLYETVYVPVSKRR